MRGQPEACARSTLAAICSLALAGLLTARPAISQEANADDPWSVFRTLAGTWEGSIEGKLGTGKGIRAYEFILEDQFVLVRQSSVRQPQPESPKGDHHQELGVFSHDGSLGAILYTQFIVEGFVLRYVCDVELAERIIACTTESIHNGEGFRARETIRLTSDHSFEETFELAEPGQQLDVLFTNSWTRKPALE